MITKMNPGARFAATLLCLVIFYGCGATSRPDPDPAAANAPRARGDAIVAESAEFLIVTAAAGDSFESLAERYLGASSKGWMIEEFNDARPLAAGQTIVIPKKFWNPTGVYPNGYQLVPILCYHDIGPTAKGRLLIAEKTFQEQMRYLKNNGFRAVTLSEYYEFLTQKRQLPRKTVVITFDDGYADNEELAAPILARLGLSATFFITTGFIGGGCMWNDQVIESIRGIRAPELDLRPFGMQVLPLDSDAARRRAVTDVLTAIKHLEQARRQAIADAIGAMAGFERAPSLMMSADQLRAMRQRHRMDIGAHTITHPILTRLSNDAARHEISRGKRELEMMIGETVHLFAYPNGAPGQDYRPEHAAMARDCGFTAAVSTAWGAASAASDRFQLPRFTPWDRTRMRYGMRLLHNLQRTERIAA
jgi:peptidoglycan/xylan/chitin deacetylase (PgdA/CDA1 family)